MATPPARDDRVFPSTRWVAIFIVLFLLPAFVILYIFPDSTDQVWAWKIVPHMTPIVMGAGYLSGAYFFWTVFRATRWHTVTRGFPMIAVFTACMGLATVLHLDRFHLTPGTLGNVAFWVWAGLYAVTPFLVPILWLRNRVTDPHTPTPDEVIVPRAVRWAMGLAGALELAVATFLWVRPDLANEIWPWAITPLTARVMGGWLALPGLGRLAIALDPRWSAWRIIVQIAALWHALVLLGVVRAWGDIDPTRPFTWIYLGFTAISLVALCGLMVVFETRQAKK